MSEHPSPERLALRGIEHRFGRKLVLCGIDLTVVAGEIVGIAGSNGAGKSTLLTIAAGLLQPFAGHRRWFGEAGEEPRLQQRGELALLGHNPQLWPVLTARENLELFIALRRRANLPSLPADELLDRLGLLPVGDRKVGGFSRGMQQRLALARALLGAPRLLLLDEPLTALDEEGRARVLEILAAERARGTAVLLSAHDSELLERLCDRKLALQAGRLVAREPQAVGFPAGLGEPC